MSDAVSALSVLGEKANNHLIHTWALFQGFTLVPSISNHCAQPTLDQADAPLQRGELIFQTLLAQCCHPCVWATCTALSCSLPVLSTSGGHFPLCSLGTEPKGDVPSSSSSMASSTALRLMEGPTDTCEVQKDCKKTHNFKKLWSVFRGLTRTEDQEKI